MPNYQALSPKRHAKLRWTRPIHFKFAAKDTVVTLLEAEVPAVLANLPVGFMPRDGRYWPVALLGLAAQHNVVVTPEGQWAGGHVPMAYRYAPFELVATGQAAQHTLVCDLDSPLISETAGDPLFGDDGKPAPALTALTDSLRMVGAAKANTQALCERLAELALLKPWAIEVQTLSGKKKIEGIYCVDEDRLGQLTEPQWSQLRQANALRLIYGQLFAMQQLQRLVLLANGQEAQARLQKVRDHGVAASSSLSPELSAIDSHGTIQFGRAG